MAENKLPKSLRHWGRRHGIVFDHDGHGLSRRAVHLAGCVDVERRFYYVAHQNELRICDGWFDKWRNSTGAAVPAPRTMAGFDSAIVRLLAEAVITLPGCRKNFVDTIVRLRRSAQDCRDQITGIDAFYAPHRQAFASHPRRLQSCLKAQRKEMRAAHEDLAKIQRQLRDEEQRLARFDALSV